MKTETKNRINLIAWMVVALTLSAMVVCYWHKFDCNTVTLFMALAFHGCFPLLGYVLIRECIREHDEEFTYKGRRI